MSHKQPGLDDRHRDADGRISQKHGNTQIGTLRDIYGNDFAAEYRSDMHLKTLLEKTGAKSLTDYIKRSK